MKHEYKIISKGLYNETVDGKEILAVKQYIYVREKNKKYLMLRFLNNAKFIINSFEFWIIQKNSEGFEIGQNKIRIKDINARPGEIFAPEKCFLVKDKCVDFDVRFVVIKSGKYEYRIKNNESFVRYPLESSWKYQSREKKYTHQESKPRKKVKFTASILVATVVMIFIGMFWPLFSEVIWPAILEVIENFFDFIRDKISQIF